MFTPTSYDPSHIWLPFCASFSEWLPSSSSKTHRSSHSFRSRRRSQSSAMKPAYRAAIALNNLAGSLMERGFDRQAIATFRDAVGLMQVAHHEPTPHESASTKETRLDKQVRHAFQRMASCSAVDDVCSSISFSCVSDDSDFSSSVDSVLESIAHPLSEAAWLIRIEEYGSEELSHRDFDVDTAIMLHNYGMACLNHSMKVSNTVAAQKLRVSAVKLMSWSRTVLCACVKKSEAEESAVLGERVLFITMIVTRSMAQTLYYTRQASQFVNECLQHLSHLGTVAQELGYCGRSRLIAAAAA